MTVRGGGGGVEIQAGTVVQAGGILDFSNSNGVSFGISNGVLTATVTAFASATAGIAGISAAGQNATSGTVTFSNSNGVSFGQAAGVITASYNSTQYAGTGTTFGGANISGSATLNSAGLNLSLSAPGGVGISGGISSVNTGTVVFSNANGVTFNLVGSTMTASYNSTQFAGSGTTFAGTNVSGSATLNSAGLNLALSAPSVGGAQTGISGVVVSNATYTSGTVSFSNANGITFGSSAGQAVTASYNSTQFAGSGTTFGGTNISGSMTLNSAGLALSLSGGAGSGGGASTGAIYVAGNTTGQSSSSTYPISSLNVSGSGIVSAGWSSNTLIISAPGTTGLTQMSAGISGGNTSGNTGTVAQGQIVFAGGNNVTLSGSTNGSSMTVTISAGAGGGGSPNISAGTTSNNLGTIVFSNSNGVSFGLNGSTITGAIAGEGVSTGGNTSGNTGMYSGQVVLAGGNNITLSVSSGAGGAQTITISGATVAAAPVNFSAGTTSNNLASVVFSNSNGISFGLNGSTITGSVPATSLLTGVNGITVSTNGSTISISGAGAGGPDVTAAGNTTGTLALVSTGTLTLAGGNNITLSQNGNAITISGANAGGAQTGISGIVVSNTTYTSGTVSFSNANGITFGSSAGQAITASYNSTQFAGSGTTFNGVNVSGSMTLNSAGLNLSLSGGAGGGIAIAASNTTFTSGTVVLSAAGGALTISSGAQSALFSVPATSSLSATGIVSLSVNGSTISIGAPAYAATLSRMDFWPAGAISSSQQTNGSASFRYIQVGEPVSFTRVDVPILVSLGSSGTTNTGDIEISSGMVLYSRSGSTLSPIVGAFGTTTISWASNTSNWSNLTGGKNVSFPIASSLTPGEYWVGFQLSTTNNSSIGLSTTLLGNTLSMLVGSTYTASQIGDFGSTYVASQNVISQGVNSVTITATGMTIPMSNITASGTAGVAANFPVIFRNY